MSKAQDVCRRARAIVRDKFRFVPLKEAQFLWHHEPNADGKWLEESFVVVPQMDEDVGKLPLNELSSSTGADTAGWPDHVALNPALVFGGVLARDWLSEEEKFEAIAEFGKIEELDWARQILRGLAYEHGAFHDDEDERAIWAPMNSIEDVERFRDELIAKAC